MSRSTGKPGFAYRVCAALSLGDTTAIGILGGLSGLAGGLLAHPTVRFFEARDAAR